MLQNGQITAGSTAMSLSITGGSAITLTKVSGSGNSNEFVVSTDTDTRTRRRIKATTSKATANNGMASGFTLDKGTLELISPKTLANGKMDYPKITVTYNTSVENTAAEKTELRRLLAQMALDSDFDDFWNIQSNQ